MELPRSSGIILHPTSLPGPDGIGDLGPEAYRWVKFIADAGCSLWQILPLGPTGYGDSPYQCFSAFAGNPFLVSPTLLLQDGLLTAADLNDRPLFPALSVDYGPVIDWKTEVLKRAYEHYQQGKAPELASELERFIRDHASWLDGYALFMSIKLTHGGQSWEQWPAPLRNQTPAALADFRAAHQELIDRQIFNQFLFFRQWKQLREYAHACGVRVIGDVPIFVAFDSADAWSNRELFYFNSKGEPSVVAGVPPDYFSPTGQLWGNPLYRWDVHKQTGYAWWIKRVQASLELYDYVRIDHFRGFAAYWEVQYGQPTAAEGKWVPGPGADLFHALEAALGSLPIIAEDLGDITPDVIELRDQLNLPGMKVLQFAFDGDPEQPFLPHNYIKNCVAYTGTHDNDTTVGWYQTAADVERDFARRYLARSGDDIAWDLIRAAWSSVAAVAVAPLQDLLALGGEARMNYPGRPSGNWSWRMAPDALSSGLFSRLKETNTLYSRFKPAVE